MECDCNVTATEAEHIVLCNDDFVGFIELLQTALTNLDNTDEVSPANTGTDT
jgi:hypothetical protein